MRVLMKVCMDAAGANRAVKEGAIAKVINNVFESYKPESAYFGTEDGRRTAYFFLDLKEPSQTPALAEPFFQEAQAEVKFIPVMNREELFRGLEGLKR